MAEIVNDAPNRFAMVNDQGDQLHVFRVPAGVVVHIATDQGEEFQQVAAMCVPDDFAPFLLHAIARMSGSEVEA